MDAFGDLDDVGDHSGFAADPSVALVTAADSAMPMPMPMPMPPGVSVPLTHPGRPDSRLAAAGAFRLPHHLTVFLQTHAHSPQTG